ncbi:hypothetical protein VNO77_30767 [Canavalia gladiata]|uniref:Uncharacterized protein n=1 Tax=Canavalia gladiata TaxID=3824 RepID=A0AAN9KS54_CANGL
MKHAWNQYSFHLCLWVMQNKMRKHDRFGNQNRAIVAVAFKCPLIWECCDCAKNQSPCFQKLRSRLEKDNCMNKNAHALFDIPCSVGATLKINLSKVTNLL